MLVYPRSPASSTPCGRITRTATAQTRTARCTSSIFTLISSRSQGDSRRQQQLRLRQQRRRRRRRQHPVADRRPRQDLVPLPLLVHKRSELENRRSNLEATDSGEPTSPDVILIVLQLV